MAGSYWQGDDQTAIPMKNGTVAGVKDGGRRIFFDHGRAHDDLAGLQLCALQHRAIDLAHAGKDHGPMALRDSRWDALVLQAGE
jgi:hypothetical protein